MPGQWGTAVDSTPNGRRRYQASGRSNALFTRGNATYWGESDHARKIMNVDDAGIRPARRPYAELEYVPARTDVKVHTCPGCGIVPPRGRPCDQCWG